ncbi:carbohydrate ABC transporter permease [Microbacterium ulmi]|uniref:Carbohydrate ABC transporter permease n=1 Tax=Microbacterium ulmi TaxID=179095 RepID=A0A7Y2PYS3_9MICO|nr:carbohydrate ABC transporter permease [Microbacterium ulmi]NII68666.1 alpha-glucoside transport system permease protein [Microbacterium ulmi]NNH03671.1 carbohydrate ABC transporter permease [Microbacterium ulmi]
MTAIVEIPKTEAPKSRRSQRRAERLAEPKKKANPLVHILLVVACVVWIVPALGLLVASFRTAQATNQSGWWTAFVPPWDFTFDNYIFVLERAGIWTAFLNSFYITIPATVLVTMVAGFAAYAFAWMKFPGRDFIFLVMVGLLVVPLQVTLIPVLSLFRGTELAGSFLALWLAHTGYGLPFAVYLLRNYIGGLPGSVFEAAEIDGAGHATIFFRLVIPMSVPALASLVIFQFLWVWNDLLVALVFLGPVPQNLPLPVTLANLTTNFGGNWQFVTAAAFISMAVPLLVFFLLQRFFVQGVTAGSVKG